jgi:1-acyl-sn-glycerol-3-phosphate acyltransferase
MNRQPFQTPPRWWAPKLTPWWVRLWNPARRRMLQRQQKMAQIDVQGLEPLRQALTEGAGVLITPNHSFHYDSYVLFEAAHQLGRHFHFLTAWQVFAMSSRFERWSMQLHGCFSIDRENTDLQAFKQAVEILRTSRFPLVIFPEGDIYHTNDRLTPFRDGAAAIALAAARRARRPIVCVPCALKYWYLDDPTVHMQRLLSRLEDRLLWRPRPDLPLAERIHRLAEGALMLKEIEYLGRAQQGPIPIRTGRLIDEVLSRLEERHKLTRRTPASPAERGRGQGVLERVKELRRHIIRHREQPNLPSEQRKQLDEDMEDLFFVTQLFSYPGDYLAKKPTIERIAETLDKFEEDILKKEYPSVHGRRRVAVRFGAPICVSAEREKNAVERLTDTLEQQVQRLLDALNGGNEVG